MFQVGREEFEEWLKFALCKRWCLCNGQHHKVGKLGFYLGVFWQMRTIVLH
jgi:hypothetical protein